MRRWLSGLLAVLTLFTLAACGGAAVPEGTGRFEDAKIDLPVAEEGPEDAEDPGDAAAPEEAAPEDGAGPEDAPPEGAGEGEPSDGGDGAAEEAPLPEDGVYTTKEDVALYLHTYGHLPDNFITKREAQDLGWSGGSLEPYAPGCCIGGSRFGNYEGLLPEARGRTYTECDIDTLGAGSRGAKRIVFSNDGLIYYTGDHYESFELLYGGGGDG